MSRVSKTLREQARRRADGRCEYCRMPDVTSFYSYQVDHVIPIFKPLIAATPPRRFAYRL
ncbi:MAG: HNH endonuclease signature motif containing protein [Chloroflexota bacterium]|nr:HNH endonuclease signature motif containing protein [Chloroflexota bacterium]